MKVYYTQLAIKLNYKYKTTLFNWKRVKRVGEGHLRALRLAVVKLQSGDYSAMSDEESSSDDSGDDPNEGLE